MELDRRRNLHMLATVSRWGFLVYVLLLVLFFVATAVPTLDVYVFATYKLSLVCAWTLVFFEFCTVGYSIYVLRRDTIFPKGEFWSSIVVLLATLIIQAVISILARVIVSEPFLE